MSFTLRQIKSHPIRLPESNRIKASNDEYFEAEQVAVGQRARVRARPAAAVGAPEGQRPKSHLPDSILDSKHRFSRIESGIALAGFAIIAATLAMSWISWDNDYAIVGDADTAYNYGLTGGIMMLVILLYALRKRIKFMSAWGDITYWYYIHFTLGIVSPVLIVLHTNFELRSVNASIAFVAVLLVVCSGFLGRYIYTRASYGVSFMEREMSSLEKMNAGGIFASKLPIIIDLEKRIVVFRDSMMNPPEGFVRIVMAVLTSNLRCRMFQAKTARQLEQVMQTIGRTEGWNEVLLRQRLEDEHGSMRTYISLIGNIITSQAFEKLAAKWRMLHVPILYLLALSVAAHVVAVHMY